MLDNILYETVSYKIGSREDVKTSTVCQNEIFYSVKFKVMMMLSIGIVIGWNSHYLFSTIWLRTCKTYFWLLGHWWEGLDIESDS